MSRIHSDSIDVTFADPPFNLKKKYNDYKDDKEFHDYLEWCRKWLYEMVRITKPTGSIFVHNIPRWLTYYSRFLNEYAYFKDWIAWDALGMPMGKGLQPAHYGILFYAKDLKKNKCYRLHRPHVRCRKCDFLLRDYGGEKYRLHPIGPVLSDIWTDIHRIRHRKRRDMHPCQLPVHLLERIILMSTDEGDLVLDPFVGTGTTAIAAKKLGRRFIGIDIDEQYVQIAKKNLDQVTANSKIGNVWIGFFPSSHEIVTVRQKDWEELEKYFDVPENRKEIEFTKVDLKI